MRHLHVGVLPILLLAAAGCSSSSPHDMSGASTPSAAALTAADRNFIAQAAYGGWSEVALGQLAQQQGASPDVRQAGAMMVSDHTQANQQLAALAQTHGLIAPTAADPGRQGVAAYLESLSGPNFDAQYVQEQIADHEVALALFRNEASSTQDPGLRSFAQNYTPILERHYSTLRQISTAGM